jgi:Ser/Thr protein kinase RdoA (MazF antagonist)
VAARAASWLTTAVLTDDALRTALAERWNLPDASVVAHNGGMNSATWFVGDQDRRWVAKAVAASSRHGFRAGLAVATTVERAGIAAGAPVPTTDGRLVASVDGVPLALLTWVPGSELTGADPGELRLMGATLAAAHAALRGVAVDDMDHFHWVDPDAEHLAVRAWIREPVAAAVAALDELGPASLSHGLVHSDPAPEAFRLDAARGTCGLIDWSVALWAPLLYDLASAVMYVGGPDRAEPLVDAYLARGLLSSEEVERGLVTMLRFRWAVQADYFARRVVTDDMTGIATAAENEKGLADARRGLGRLAGPA